MTPRERVHAALQRRPADRVPIFMWFHPVTADLLGTSFGISPSLVADFLGNDVHQRWVGNNHSMEGIIHEHDGDTHTDDWGITWVKEGHFNQVLHSPLVDAEPAALRSYRFPVNRIPHMAAGMEQICRSADSYFRGCDISPCLFELLCRIRGMENAAMDLAANTEESEVLLEHTTEFGVRLAEAACDMFPIDWLWTGDDVAGQETLIMSPSVWRAMIKPRLARIVAVGKSRGLPVAYHCCGAIRPIIPDLIEIGIDVLNPVQTTCPGMAPEELKREYGEHLTFMGGVDTVDLLPHGTAEEVYEATRRLIDVLGGGGGGYILSASHTVPPETPLANILAMYRAAGVEPGA